MSQHERVKWAQLRVGLMVITGLVLFAVAVFFVSSEVGAFTRHYIVKTYLPNAGDLREGAQVRVSGIAVGNVAKIRMSPFPDKDRAVEIDLKISDTFKRDICEDSVASVETVGLLGDSYMDITRGSPDQPPIPPGGTVKAASKADMAAVMQNANQAVTNLNKLSSQLADITSQIQAGKGTVGKLIYDPSLYNKLDATVSGAQTLVDRTNRGEGTIGKLMSDETLYNKTLATLDRLNQVIDEVQHGEGSLAKFISDPSVYNNLNRLMTNGNTLIDGINQGHGTLGKLVKDEQMYDRMNSTLQHLDTITGRMEQGQGTLGKLSTDAALFNNLSDTSQSMKELLTDFRKNPKKYLTIKLHIF